MFIEQNTTGTQTNEKKTQEKEITCNKMDIFVDGFEQGLTELT